MQVSGTPVDAAPVGPPGRLRRRREVLGVVFEQSLVTPSTTSSAAAREGGARFSTVLSDF